MAALVKAINAKIRSNPAVSYVCSTRKLVFYTFDEKGRELGVGVV